MKRKILCLCLLVFALALLLALPVAAEETKTIKAGTYRFNDELTVPSVSADKGVKFSFILNGEAVIGVLGSEAVIGCSGMELIRQDAQGYPLDVYYICETSSVDLSAFVTALPHSFCVYDSNGWRIADYGEGIQTITITEDTEVSADFYEWFTANAKPLLDNECTNYTNALYACDCGTGLNAAWNGAEWERDGDGYTVYSDFCNDCGVSIEYTVWDDHDYMQTVIGTELYNVCQNCADRVLIGDYVLGDGNEEDSDCVHTFTTFVIDPTCEGRGSTWYECSKCGFAFETDFVDKIPHQYQVVGRKEPTCTVSGYLISECETCGKAAPSDDTFLPPLGHSWKTVSSILGDDDMITTKSECERCHVTKTETFPTAAGQAQNWLLTVIRGLFSGGIDMYETVANGIEVGGVTAGEVITGSLIISCFLLLLLLILKVLR